MKGHTNFALSWHFKLSAYLHLPVWFWGCVIVAFVSCLVLFNLLSAMHILMVSKGCDYNSHCSNVHSSICLFISKRTWLYLKRNVFYKASFSTMSTIAISYAKVMRCDISNKWYWWNHPQAISLAIVNDKIKIENQQHFSKLGNGVIRTIYTETVLSRYSISCSHRNAQHI